MASSTKNKAKSKSKKASLTKSKKKATTKKSKVAPIWKEAQELESLLEEKLLEDAVLSARLALQELEEETRKAPFERRSGLRLREKALKSERAFNRLRALRKGEMIPERHDDD